MDNIVDLEENSKSYKMTLLYTQTSELHKKYNEEMELSPMKYYLVDKKWLDDYKAKNNYNEFAKKLMNNPNYTDYISVEFKLSKSINIDKKQLTVIDVENIINNFFSSKKEHIEKYDLDVPINIELVYERFFEDCLKDYNQIGFSKFDVYLGNKDILISEDENKVIYCCSLVSNDNNNYNFCVKVDYIIIFKSIDDENNQINQIADLGGLKNYLIKHNIDINKKEEQTIKDNGKKVGFFIKFEKNDDIFNLDMNSVNNMNLNMNNPPNIQNSGINNSNLNPNYDFSSNQMNGDIQNSIKNPMKQENFNPFSAFEPNNLKYLNIKLNDSGINQINNNNQNNNNNIIMNQPQKDIQKQMIPFSQQEIQPLSQPQIQSPSQQEIQPPSQQEIQPPSQPQIQPLSQQQIQPPSQPQVQPPSQQKIQPPPQPQIQLSSDQIQNQIQPKNNLSQQNMQPPIQPPFSQQQIHPQNIPSQQQIQQPSESSQQQMQPQIQSPMQQQIQSPMQQQQIQPQIQQQMQPPSQPQFQQPQMQPPQQQQ